MSSVLRVLSDIDAAQSEQSGPVLHPEEFAKILRLRPQIDPAPTSSRQQPATSPVTEHEITSALDLVREAASRIRDADERVRASEARTQALLTRAAEELKSADARAKTAEALATAAEARAKDAETRIREAETRAEEAENWLRQIFATISEELPARL